MNYLKVKTKPVNGIENDCHYCCFKLACINICKLEPGYHYEKVERGYKK